MAHCLYKRRVFFFARWISQFARFATGIEIHPGAVLGRELFIDHGMGIVMGMVWNIARYGTKFQDMYKLLLKMDQVLGLDFDKAAEKAGSKAAELDPEIQELVDQRQQARKEKNWKIADEIRDKLNAMGIQLEDTPQGVKVVLKER